MKQGKVKTMILLHLLLMVYSMSTVFSKLAAGERFMSLRFCFCYAAILLLLGIYAIGWQQVIKRLPLTLAFANKAVTIVWGLLWGLFLFQETVTVRKLLGSALVIAGVILFAAGDEGAQHE